MPKHPGKLPVPVLARIPTWRQQARMWRSEKESFFVSQFMLHDTIYHPPPLHLFSSTFLNTTDLVHCWNQFVQFSSRPCFLFSDINECSQALSPCFGQQGTCVNTYGGYYCIDGVISRKFLSFSFQRTRFSQSLKCCCFYELFGFPKGEQQRTVLESNNCSHKEHSKNGI